MMPLKLRPLHPGLLLGPPARLSQWGAAVLLTAAPLVAQGGPSAGSPAAEPPSGTSRRAAQNRVAAAQAPDGARFYERDLRTSFDRRSATLARADLEELEPGAPGYESALFTLGAAGALESRAVLVESTSEFTSESTLEAAATQDRLAAIFALGELKARVGPAIDVLLALTTDDDPAVRTAAMVASIRTGVSAGRQHVATLAGGAGSAAGEARDVLAFAADPTGQGLPSAFRRLYQLRWNAARAYGFIDGAVWASTLMDELSENEPFLQALVLQLVLDLKIEGARDHLLEALLDGDGVRRIVVGAQRMPVVIESMIDAGVWRPADWKEWKWLMLTILHEELAYLFPRTIQLAVAQPSAAAAAVAFLQRSEGRYGELVERSLSHEDPSVRALAAFALGAAGNPDYTARLLEVSEDPVAWVRANAIGALIRMGNVGGNIRAGRILSLPPEDREPRMTSYLFQVLERAAPDANVIEFLQDAAPRLDGPDRAAADAILLLYSRAPVETGVLRRELPGMVATNPEAIFGARALARRPGASDLRVMARLFPREGAADMNLALASGLAQSGHRSVEPLLQKAVWELPWNVSVLAAGVVRATYGERTLISWAANPPVETTEQDVRRLGYAIGEWGGMPAVEALRRRLNSAAGADLPALQGAILGALAARTR